MDDSGAPAFANFTPIGTSLLDLVPRFKVAALKELTSASGFHFLAGPFASVLALIALTTSAAVADPGIPPPVAAKIECKIKNRMLALNDGLSDATKARVELDGTLTLAIPATADAAECIGNAPELVLFVDHMPVAGLTPLTQKLDSSKKEISLTYRVQATAASRPIWNELLLQAWNAGKARSVQVGVGIGKATLIETFVSQNQVELKIGGLGRTAAWSALAASFLALLAVGWLSSAVQDRTGKTSSLSRLILATWMLTSISAVLLAYQQTGALPALVDTSSLMWLLAIGGLTATAAPAIDAIRPSLSSMLNTMAGAPPNPPVPQVPANTTPNAGAAKQPQPKPDATPSVGAMSTALQTGSKLYRDLVTDSDGLALHRLQALVFTAVVLIVVWRELIVTGSVANVESTWFKLIGASSLTYLFGKTTEKR